jgi:hypothetical protein
MLVDYITSYERISMRLLKRLKFGLKRYWANWKYFIGIEQNSLRFQVFYTIGYGLALIAVGVLFYIITK